MNENLMVEVEETTPAATHSPTHSNALVENPFD